MSSSRLDTVTFGRAGSELSVVVSFVADDCGWEPVSDVGLLPHAATDNAMTMDSKQTSGFFFMMTPFSAGGMSWHVLGDDRHGIFAASIAANANGCSPLSPGSNAPISVVN